jgi:four helix bundle protein
MRRFDSLKVWRRSHALVLQVYEVTRRFPNDERYGLCSQVRRAAVSVPANVAEGCKRSSDADFARHVSIAEGSASEVDYLLLLAAELGYLDPERCVRLRTELEEISRMLDSLRMTLVANR